MSTQRVLLDTIDDVKRFVSLVTAFDFDVDLVSGRYAVDAKSILGIFSLDLSKPIEIRLHTENPAAPLEKLRDFLVS